MISCDTNILFMAMNRSAKLHVRARAFLNDHLHDAEFCLCEQVLLELYVLLRNPAVSTPALTADTAADVIRIFRSNSAWRIVDVPGERRMMDRLWRHAAEPSFARRRIFEARLALTLRYHGVSEFATRNTKDFQGFDFERVWDPTET